MSDFDFKKVLKENIIERENKKINEEQDINEFVRGFFRPRFGTNLAAINSPSEEDEEGEESEEGLKIEPGEVYVVAIVDPEGNKKIGAGYAKVAKNYTNTSDDKVPIEKIQLPPESEKNNKNKKVKDILIKKAFAKMRELPKNQFIRKADKEDLRLDKVNLNENTAASIVDSNADLLAIFLKATDRSANGKVKAIFKPFFEEAGIPFKSGRAVDDLLDLMRQVATNKKIRTKMASLAAKQNESMSENLNENTAASIVDNNADLLAIFLKATDRSANGKVKAIFKPFFEEAGIPFKSGRAVDDILDLMRQVATNKKIRTKMASLAAKQNESMDTLLVTEGLLDRLKSFFATNKKPDNERMAKINKLAQVIQSGEYRTNLPSDDVEDIAKIAQETLAKYDFEADTKRTQDALAKYDPEAAKKRSREILAKYDLDNNENTE